MQGPKEVSLEQIKAAADEAKPNPDLVFFKIAEDRAKQLRKWATGCKEVDFSAGALAAAAVSA